LFLLFVWKKLSGHNKMWGKTKILVMNYPRMPSVSTGLGGPH